MSTTTHRGHTLPPALLVVALHLIGPVAGTGQVLVFPGANSRETYFSMHNIHAAHALSRGAGVRVGIMDHSFGVDVHTALYAGGETFQDERHHEAYRRGSSHGYWMALVLREVAPEVEIYALGTSDPDDEAAKVGAMVKAIDWAIAHRLDVLTYSDRRFSAAFRPALDSAVNRAHAAGIVTTFIHYPHPGNLLPGSIGPRSGDDGREPDLNIFHYNYITVSPARVARWEASDRQHPGDHPFASMSGTSPVTAGLVALLRSVEPTLGPEDCRRLLQEAARPVTFEGRTGPRVPDVYRALRDLTDRRAPR
jgi:subtilisin family serine protease